MAYDITGRRRPTKTKKHDHAQKRKRDDVDVAKLQQAVDELDIAAHFDKFADLPLSDPTKAGLKACHFISLTQIQAKAVALGLKGVDILGAAKTGSGKTLAFLVPVLENLYREQCVGPDAGLGAMIISPTRELAIQIFDVLYKIGKCGHMFAAGLIIGGKNLHEEQNALARMNIVVCTPGRMLQHLSQTSALNVDNLRILVLDEADRILDMGFQRDLDAILEYLPQDRQTLLFSATQTRKISDLARLSLRDPEYVAVHESATSATPQTLQQNYVLTPLPTKLDTLWSFLQSSKKAKLLIFLSSGKQVRFVYECFRQMQPGIPLLHLHGRQKQTTRLEVTRRFSSAKYSCLFATDVAARGLDFPAVDWVVQVDCPEDADTYIHRVGRTARYERDGRAVLFLDPSEEEGMLERLSSKKVPIERINIRAKKQSSVKDQVQGMCFKDPALKYLGQKAFASYVRSLHIQKDKEIFNIEAYALEEFASSLGLPGAPRIKFVKGDGEAAKRAKNAPRVEISESEPDTGEDVEEEGAKDGLSKATKKKGAVRTKHDRMFERRNNDILSSHYSSMIADDNAERDVGDDAKASANGHFPQRNAQSIVNKEQDNDEDDDLFTVKRRILPTAETITAEAPSNKPDPDQPSTLSHRRTRALQTRKGAARLVGGAPTKLVFEDDGTSHAPQLPFESDADANAAERAAQRERFLATETVKLAAADEVDRGVAGEKRRAKKVKRKQAERRAEADGVSDEEEDGLLGDGRLERIERPFEELADLYPSEDDGAGDASGIVNRDEEVEPRERKRKAKDYKKGGMRERPHAPAKTLEDLEKLAAGLLG